MRGRGPSGIKRKGKDIRVALSWPVNVERGDIFMTVLSNRNYIFSGKYFNSKYIPFIVLCFLATFLINIQIY